MSIDPRELLEYEQKADLSLIEALMQATDGMFDRMHNTVMGNDPIATGAWISWYDGNPCGCLLFDGYGKENSLREADDTLTEVSCEIEDPESAAFELLSSFYGEAWDDSAAVGIYNAYDSWAMNGMPYTTYILNPRDATRRVMSRLSEPGRQELRELFVKAQQMRDERVVR